MSYPLQLVSPAGALTKNIMKYYLESKNGYTTAINYAEFRKFSRRKFSKVRCWVQGGEVIARSVILDGLRHG